jgi:hypothetical protein
MQPTTTRFPTFPPPPALLGARLGTHLFHRPPSHATTLGSEGARRRPRPHQGTEGIIILRLALMALGTPAEPNRGSIKQSGGLPASDQIASTSK